MLVKATLNSKQQRPGTNRPRRHWIWVLVFLVLLEGVNHVTVTGAPTDSRRLHYQTSASPIPHPDKVSLKKSSTANALRDKFIWINFGNPVYSTTPQVPEEEVGVKKSSTAERPLGIEQLGERDSVESILNLKTNPNSAEQTKLTENSNLISRVLHNEDDKLDNVWKNDRGMQVAKKFDTPDADAVAQSTFLRGQTSRNPIARPEKMDDNSLVKKNTPAQLDDAADVLQRKTLLYSEPAYRPVSGAPRKEVFSDPRQLISILGDPSTYKKDHIAYRTPSRTKKVQVSYEPGRNRKHAQRKHHVVDDDDAWSESQRPEDWGDQEEHNMGSFVSQDPEDGLMRREPSEHRMLENLLGDSSPSFGTRDEKMEKETTIKQIEQLTAQSSVLSKDFDPSLTSSFSNMEISEGELPDYDHGAQRYNVRSRVPKKKLKTREFRKVAARPYGRSGGVVVPRVEIEQADKRVEEFVKQSPHPESRLGLVGELYPRYYIPYVPAGWREPAPGFTGGYTSPQPQGGKLKRSTHHRRHHHRWRSRDLHYRSPEQSRYYDYPDEPENEHFNGAAIRFNDFPRFPLPEKLPTFPLSDMAEPFVPFAPLPKISEFAPVSLPIEKLKRLPEPSPIPPAIVDPAEEQEDAPEPGFLNEAEPVAEWAPLPEPVPEPEPTPIPELASIREIPPIAEPKPETPPNLDPKKTFDTGESNGGVKKSSSR